jgi:hypothetical protein
MRNSREQQTRNIAMEGSQSMQPYFDKSAPRVSSQSSSIAEHEMVSAGKDFLPELAGPVDENRSLNSADELANAGEIPWKSRVGGLEGLRRWKRPSLATLRLTLIAHCFARTGTGSGTTASRGVEYVK